MPFQDYLTPQGDLNLVTGEPVRIFLAGQKKRIERCIEKIHPRRVVFLGAGFLNDIPIETINVGPELMNLDIRETPTGHRSAIQAAVLHPIKSSQGMNVP